MLLHFAFSCDSKLQGFIFTIVCCCKSNHLLIIWKEKELSIPFCVCLHWHAHVSNTLFFSYSFSQTAAPGHWSIEVGYRFCILVRSVICFVTHTKTLMNRPKEKRECCCIHPYVNCIIAQEPRVFVGLLWLLVHPACTLPTYCLRCIDNTAKRR